MTVSSSGYEKAIYTVVKFEGNAIYARSDEGHEVLRNADVPPTRTEQKVSLFVMFALMKLRKTRFQKEVISTVLNMEASPDHLFRILSRNVSSQNKRQILSLSKPMRTMKEKH